MSSNELISLLVFSFLLGIGLCASGSYIPWKWGRCIQPSVKKDFDVDRFFNGRWYEQASFGNFLFQATGICPTVQYKIDDGQIKELDYHFEQALMKYITVQGSSYTQFIKGGEGYLPVTYSILGGLLSYEAPIYIVETDYVNWALIYSCRQQLLLKAEMSWVMSRTRTGWQISEAVNQTISDNGLNPDDYIKAVNIGCGPNEPNL